MPEIHNTSQAKKRFLSHYAKHGRFYAAAKHADRSGRCVYDWLDEKKPAYDAKFKAAFEDAKQEFIEKLEKEADRRATEGTRKPVFYLGKKCGEIKEFSDTLLMFRLKGLDPETYRDNQKVELTGKDGKELPSPSFFFVMPDGTKKTAQEVANGNSDRKPG